MFILPLFVPRKHVSFEFGKRIGEDRWSANAPDLIPKLANVLKREALPFLSNIESPSDVARMATSLRLPQNPHVQQAISYACASSGDLDRAKNELNQLVCLLDVKVPWQREMAERAESLKAKLFANPKEAQDQLETCEAETLRNLGLENFR